MLVAQTKRPDGEGARGGPHAVRAGGGGREELRGRERGCGDDVYRSGLSRDVPIYCPAHLHQDLKRTRVSRCLGCTTKIGHVARRKGSCLARCHSLTRLVHLPYLRIFLSVIDWKFLLPRAAEFRCASASGADARIDVGLKLGSGGMRQFRPFFHRAAFGGIQAPSHRESPQWDRSLLSASLRLAAPTFHSPRKSARWIPHPNLSIESNMATATQSRSTE